MNVTTFKSLLSPKLPAEQKRLKDLTASILRNVSFNHYGKDLKMIEPADVKPLWQLVNKYYADWEKSSRKQRHEMRTSRHRYVDYSHLAYNGVADDL